MFWVIACCNCVISASNTNNDDTLIDDSGCKNSKNDCDVFAEGDSYLIMSNDNGKINDLMSESMEITVAMQVENRSSSSLNNNVHSLESNAM